MMICRACDFCEKEMSSENACIKLKLKSVSGKILHLELNLPNSFTGSTDADVCRTCLLRAVRESILSMDEE